MMASKTDEIVIALLASLGPLLWAGNFVVARSLHEAVDPFHLNYLRWVVAGIVLLPFTVRNWQQIASAWATHPFQMLALGLLSVTLFNWLVYSGLRYSSASTGGAIFALSGIFILIISQVWRGTPLRARDILGGGFAISDAGFLVHDEVNGMLSQEQLVGPVLLLAGSFVWALYTVCLRRWSVPLTPPACLATTVFSGLLIMTPFAVIWDMPSASQLAQPELLVGILYLGVGASVAAFCAWQAGVARIGAARAGFFLHLVPVFTLILGHLFLGEPVTLQRAAGIAMVLLGVVISRTGQQAV